MQKNWGQQDISRVFRSLEKNEERAKQLLTWIQDAISSGQTDSWGIQESLDLRTWVHFWKKDEFIPKTESRKPLLPSYLRKIGSVFAVVAHSAKNLSEAKSIASQALRHSLNSHTPPSDRYTIVNFKRRWQPYDQARPFILHLRWKLIT